MIFGLAFLASVFRSVTPRNRHLVSSFNKKNDQCIKAHLVCFSCFCWLQYFDCLPLKISTCCGHPIRTKYQGIKAHVFVSSCFCWLQYFDCLPLKINTWCGHSTRKMITASRRICFVFYVSFGFSISIAYPSK